MGMIHNSIQRIIYKDVDFYFGYVICFKRFAHLRSRSTINLVNFEQLKGKEVINGKTRIR